MFKYTQGDRKMNVGVVDSEYIVHSGSVITLGSSFKKVVSGDLIPRKIWKIY